MVVRRDDRNTGKMGKKIARTMVAGMVLVPGVLSNPIVMDRSFAVVLVDEPGIVPDQTIYRGQYLDLASYGLNISSNSVEISTNNGLTFDSGSFGIYGTLAGTYTIYIYNTDGTEIDSFELIVKTPDFDNDNLVDIGDLMKYISSPPAVKGVTTAFASYQIDTMLDWLDSSRQGTNSAPMANDNLPILVNPSSPYISLSCNSYFTDADGDALSYKVQSVTPSSGVDARIVDDILMLYPGSTPAHSVVTVRAYDEHGATADREFMVNEAPKLVHNLQLEVNMTPTGATPQVSTFDISPFFSDYEGHTISYSLGTSALALGSNTAYLNTTTNVLTFSFVNEDLNGEPMDITATDELGLSTTATFTVTFDDQTQSQ